MCAAHGRTGNAVRFLETALAKLAHGLDFLSTLHFKLIAHQLGDELVAAGPAVRLLGRLGPRAAPPSQHGSSPWPAGPAGKERMRQWC